MSDIDKIAEFLNIKSKEKLEDFKFVEKPFTKDDKFNKQKNSYSINSYNFVEYENIKVGGKLKTTPHLLIGFDTEYQSPDALIIPRENEDDLDLDEEVLLRFESSIEQNREDRKKGLLVNEILSYQTYCRIIIPKYDEKGNYITSESSGEEWECIIHPNTTSQNSKDGRLSLTQLLYYTVAKGIQKYSNIKIPTNCYLLSHFSRADIPSLKDFEWDESDMMDGLMNIRGVYTGSKDIEVNLDDKVKLKIQLRDTINLAPAMKKKLLDIGKMLGIKKIELGKDEEKDLDIIENMKEFMFDDYEKFKEYGILDARITTEYAHQLIIINMKETGKHNLPRTLTSIATSKLISMWKEEKWIKNKKKPELEVCGKTTYTYKRYSNNTGKLSNVSKDDYLMNVKWRIDFVANTYHGGRNEQFIFGATWIDNWSDWDLRSAYATSMCMIGLPNWETTKVIYDIEELYKLEITDLAYAQVEFKFPESIRYPCLPVRGGDSGLIFPFEGNSLCGLQELKLAKKLIDDAGEGYIRLLEGVYVETDKKRKVFQKFIEYCYKERNKAKLRKDSNGKTNSKNLFNYFWKEMSNSTYGKTAQGLRIRKIFDLTSMDVKPLPECQITQPFFASFITSMVRASLAEVMNKLPRDKMVFSVTTDGFLTNASDEDISKSQDGEICVALTKQITELGDKTNILEVKHRCKQALGWRTRGQATIKEADDWINEDGDEDRDNNIVLAKSGIKLNDRYEKYEENKKIVGYFFKRKYNHKLLYKNFSGIREMTEGRIDLVDKPVIRNLSMEFDWKRMPSFTKDSSTINDFVKFYETKTSVKLYLFEMNATFMGAEEGYNIGVGEFDEEYGISEGTTFEQYRFLKEVNSNNYPMIESLKNSCVELYGDKSSIVKGYFWTCVHNDGINPPIPDLYIILNEF